MVYYRKLYYIWIKILSTLFITFGMTSCFSNVYIEKLESLKNEKDIYFMEKTFENNKIILHAFNSFLINKVNRNRNNRTEIYVFADRQDMGDHFVYFARGFAIYKDKNGFYKVSDTEGFFESKERIYRSKPSYPCAFERNLVDVQVICLERLPYIFFSYKPQKVIEPNFHRDYYNALGGKMKVFIVDKPVHLNKLLKFIKKVKEEYPKDNEYLNSYIDKHIGLALLQTFRSYKEVPSDEKLFEKLVFAYLKHKNKNEDTLDSDPVYVIYQKSKNLSLDNIEDILKIYKTKISDDEKILLRPVLLKIVNGFERLESIDACKAFNILINYSSIFRKENIDLTRTLKYINKLVDISFDSNYVLNLPDRCDKYIMKYHPKGKEILTKTEFFKRAYNSYDINLILDFINKYPLSGLSKVLINKFSNYEEVKKLIDKNINEKEKILYILSQVHHFKDRGRIFRYLRDKNVFNINKGNIKTIYIRNSKDLPNVKKELEKLRSQNEYKLLYKLGAIYCEANPEFTMDVYLKSGYVSYDMFANMFVDIKGFPLIKFVADAKCKFIKSGEEDVSYHINTGLFSAHEFTTHKNFNLFHCELEKDVFTFIGEDICGKFRINFRDFSQKWKYKEITKDKVIEQRNVTLFSLLRDLTRETNEYKKTSRYKCSLLRDKCIGNCKYKNKDNGFFIFSDSDKEKCEKYCYQAYFKCKEGKQQEINENICRAKCVGYSKESGFLSSSRYDKCFDKCMKK